MVSKIEIGNRFCSNNSGWFTVIDFKYFTRNELRKDRRYLCEFDEYNGIKFKKWSDKKEILNGQIKNPYYPRIYGVGYIGELGKKCNKNIYAIWSQILNRCYNKKLKQYKYYHKWRKAPCFSYGEFQRKRNTNILNKRRAWYYFCKYNNGLTYLISKLKDSEIFATIKLDKSVRSEVSQLCVDRL